MEIFTHIGILTVSMITTIMIISTHTWLRQSSARYKQVYLSIVDVIMIPYTAYIVRTATDEELFRMYDFALGTSFRRSTYMIGVWLCKMEIKRRGAVRPTPNQGVGIDQELPVHS